MHDVVESASVSISGRYVVNIEIRQKQLGLGQHDLHPLAKHFCFEKKMKKCQLEEKNVQLVGKTYMYILHRL